jgi:hypothetical protein
MAALLPRIRSVWRHEGVKLSRSWHRVAHAGEPVTNLRATLMESRMRALILAALALAGCASTQRTLSYNAGYPDADVYVGEQRYQIWFHESDQTVLVQRGQPRPLGQLLAQNLTIYSQDASPGILTWGAAANAVLNPMQCAATEVTGADQMREISYTCASGVNPHAEVAQRRDAWRQGVRVPAPVQAAQQQ